MSRLGFMGLPRARDVICNGSRKSSLAYAIISRAGYTLDGGRIWFAGQEITGLSITERARLGLTLAWQ